MINFFNRKNKGRFWSYCGILLIYRANIAVFSVKNFFSKEKMRGFQ